MSKFLIDENDASFDSVLSTRNISPLLYPRHSEMSVGHQSILEKSIDKEVTINIVDQ